MKILSKLLPALALSSVVAIGCVGCNGVSNNGKEDYNSFNSEYVTEITNECVKLFSSEPVYDEEAQTIKQTITAEVSPAHAPDKTVDWSASWGTNNEGEDAKVEDYLTVRPNEDGSNIAIITVYKPFFESDINVTATTRVGKLSATCNVTYEGIPTKTAISIGDKTYKSGDVVDLVKGGTYDITLQSQNVLGNSSAKYDDYEIVSVEGIGGFFVGCDAFLPTSDVVDESYGFYFDFSNPENTAFVFSDLNMQDIYNDLLNISVENNCLSVTVKNDIADYFRIIKSNVFQFSNPSRTSYRALEVCDESVTDDYVQNQICLRYSSVYDNDIGAYYGVYYLGFLEVADEGCYIRLTVREKNTGIESYLDINMLSTVEGIQLDVSNIVF